MSANIKALYDPATGTWTYVVWSNDDPRCAIIDSVLDFDAASGRTGTKLADQVIAFVREQGLKVQWILETHIHADHLTASAYLKEKLGGKTGITRRITDSLKLWVPFFGLTDIPMDGSQFDQLFDDGEIFQIGNLDVRVMYTPGHTPADTIFVIGDAAIVGDALLMPDQGTGRCDFPGGSAADSYDSIQKIFALPDDTKLYIAHDYPAAGVEPKCVASVADHRANNVRLKGDVSRDAYVEKRQKDDAGKAVPKLILPSLQVNLRAGVLPDALTLPLNKL